MLVPEGAEVEVVLIRNKKELLLCAVFEVEDPLDGDEVKDPSGVVDVGDPLDVIEVEDPSDVVEVGGSPDVLDEAFPEVPELDIKPGPGSGVISSRPYTTFGPGSGKTTSRRSMVLQPLPMLHANMSGSSSKEACRL